MDDKSKIIDKLKKLINQAEGAQEIGSVEEAKKFAAKVQELLDKHNLSLTDIEIAAENESPVGLVLHSVFPQIYALWQELFLGTVARLNSCLIVSTGKPNTKRHIAIVGRQQDQLLVFEIYKYFETLCRHLADRGLKVAQSGIGYRRARKKRRWSVKYKDSFSTGFCGQLSMRMIKLHEESMQGAESSNAMIHVGTKLKDAEDWMYKNLKPENKPRRLAASKLNGDGFFDGVKSANSVALTHKTIDDTISCEFPRSKRNEL